MGPSFNFHQVLCGLVIFCHLPLTFRAAGRPPRLMSTFRAARRPSVNFRQPSVQPWDFPSTPIKFSCSQETFCHLPSTLHAVRRPPRPAINFPCGQETFRELMSTFRAAGRASVTFRQLLVQPWDLPPTTIKFHAATRPSFNLHNLSVRPGELQELPSTFHVVGRHSVDLRPLSMQPPDHPSSSVNFPCGHWTFCHFCELSIQP